MLLLILLFTCFHLSNANDLELFLYDIDFRNYRMLAKASDFSFIETMNFLDGDFTYVKYDDNIQSMLNVMTDYNKTTHYATHGLKVFLTNCPDLVRTGIICSTSIAEMLNYYDIAIDITSTLDNESIEDANLKLQEMESDIFDVDFTCFERNSSSYILSIMVTEAWYFVDNLEDEVNKMHLQIKQQENRLYLENGLHNYTGSIAAQKIITDIQTATGIVRNLKDTLAFCQKHILNYTLINSTSYL